jgi:hypothetical protein
MTPLGLTTLVAHLENGNPGSMVIGAVADVFIVLAPVPPTAMRLGWLPRCRARHIYSPIAAAMGVFPKARMTVDENRSIARRLAASTISVEIAVMRAARFAGTRNQGSDSRIRKGAIRSKSPDR